MAPIEVFPEYAQCPLGSKADMCAAKSHVRFTPESGHVQCTGPCLLSANSGHLKQLFLARLFCRPIRIHSLELLCSGRDIITFTISPRALRKWQARHGIAEIFHLVLCYRSFASMLPRQNPDAAQ